MRINHNIAALNTHRQLNSASNAQAKSMEKLSSGLRINKAGDDAAGLAISEKMRGQIRGLDQASRNAQDGISMIQTAEGALNETHDILQRMRELSVQASTDTNNTDDREAIGEELLQLKSEVDRISKTTTFNGKKLLNGDLSATQNGGTAVVGKALATSTSAISKIDVSGALGGDTYTLSDATGGKVTLTRGSDSVAQTITAEPTIGADGKSTLNFSELGISIEIAGASAGTAAQVAADVNSLTITTGANSSASFAIGSNGTNDEKLAVSFSKMDSTTLGSAGSEIGTLVNGAANTIVDTQAKADALTSSLDAAIKQVSKQRSTLGAAQNRLEHTINNLGTSSENLTAAESRVRDVDMAKEMMNQTKNSILSQAAQAMLAQSNQMPQGVLQLLR
ncbi:flagellin [Bacillus sp. SORGH_AS 510]|uniref:flagellin N-terminal helical domain-containing protein n=1 Tax=Bacillus sp. SORGH_AS_0510 TaxID=3041771 RepID=UPI002788A706|nr:flagellin [Bacillus sp. SORGH_AS_0510]MDQ1146299.1 flagellin [Bacillus sp. SORGH_AS_0510]